MKLKVFFDPALFYIEFRIVSDVDNINYNRILGNGEPNQ